MSRKKSQPKNYNVAEMQPDEINALKATVDEFIRRMSELDNEIELLSQDKKDLVEEFSDRLDMKTLKAALAIVKIQKGVEHQDTFDLFMEALNKV